MARLAGPLLVMPALVSFVTGSVVTYPTFLVRRWLLIGIMLAGFSGRSCSRWSAYWHRLVLHAYQLRQLLPST